jgi:hypothetical protein
MKAKGELFEAKGEYTLAHEGALALENEPVQGSPLIPRSLLRGR